MSRVKITPAEARSLRTIFCTPTERRHRLVVEAVLGAVHDGPVGEERRHAVAYLVEQLIQALHVQVALLLSRERGGGKILGGGAGADCDVGLRHRVLGGQLAVGRSHRRGNGLGQRRAPDPLADLVARGLEGGHVGDVEAPQIPIDLLGQPRFGEVLPVGVRREGEPIGNGNTLPCQLADHLAQGSVLAAHARQCIQIELPERNHQGRGSNRHGVLLRRIEGANAVPLRRSAPGSLTGRVGPSRPNALRPAPVAVAKRAEKGAPMARKLLFPEGGTEERLDAAGRDPGLYRRQRGRRPRGAPPLGGDRHLSDHARVAHGRAGRCLELPGADQPVGAGSRGHRDAERGGGGRRPARRASARRARHHVHGVPGPAADDPEPLQDRGRAHALRHPRGGSHHRHSRALDLRRSQRRDGGAPDRVCAPRQRLGPGGAGPGAGRPRRVTALPGALPALLRRLPHLPRDEHHRAAR